MNRFRNIAIALFCITLATVGLRSLTAPIINRLQANDDVVQTVITSIQTLRANEVPQLIRAQQGKPTLIYIYASWCPYCRTVTPFLKQQLDIGTFRNFNVLFFSIDVNHSRLGHYLAENGLENQVTPYLVRQSGVNDIVTHLQRNGFSFEGGIPFIALLNKDGKIVAEFSGMPDNDRLTDALQDAVGG